MEEEKMLNHRQHEASREAPKPTETTFELEGQEFSFRKYDIGETRDVPNPGLMETGNEQSTLELYADDPLLLTKHTSERYVDIPYIWLKAEGGKIFGNYATGEGQDEFMDSDLALTKQSFTPPPWAEKLWRFAKLKQARTFARDETVAALRGLEVRDGKLRFVVGAGSFSDGFYSMGSEGVTLDISDDERETLAARVSGEHMNEFEQLREKLQSEYGAGKQIREIIHAEYGGVPEFGEHVYSSTMGVAGTVLTTDGEYVFARRGRNVSVNQGINVTASGGVVYDREALSTHGIQTHLGSEMHREAKEIGLQSGTLLLGSMQRRIELELGASQDEYDLVPVGFAREVMRGGSPEMMFLVKYKGTTKDLVTTIANNPHAERQEIDQLLYTLPTARAADLIRTKGATSVIQHKGVLNLIMINEYRKQHAD